MNKTSVHKLALSITSTILAACGAHAYDLNLGTNIPPITFHGFGSQGLLASSQYDYLGYTKGISGRFTEAGANISMDPFPHTHITAQGFLFDVGNVGEYNPVLDYALVDYNFSDAFGIRAGRIIRPEGIYNSIQSVDLARTWVLLPQGMYDARYRDYSGSVDGGSVYGDLKLGKGGDMSYELYGGMVNLSQDGGVSRLLADDFRTPPYLTYDKVHGFPEVGFQLWYNTPIDGLRAGLGAYQAFGFSYDFYQSPLFFGRWNTTGYTDASVIHPSFEYEWRNWTFQAEYRMAYWDSHDEAAGQAFGRTYTVNDDWFVSAAYRFNKWLQAGVYYTEYYADTSDRDGAGTAYPSDDYQKDLALSLRFDPTSWWVIKVEGHLMHGTALLDDTATDPESGRNSKPWYMLALKTTVSF